MISDFAWVIVALPAVSAVLTMLFGKHLKGKGAEFGITAMAIAFVLAGFVAYEVFSENVAAVAELEEALHSEEGDHGGEGAGGEETSSLDGITVAVTGIGSPSR